MARRSTCCITDSSSPSTSPISKSSAESIAGVENQHVFITKTQQQQHEYTRGFPYSSFKIDKNVFIFISSTDSGRAVSTWHSQPEGLGIDPRGFHTFSPLHLNFLSRFHLYSRKKTYFSPHIRENRMIYIERMTFSHQNSRKRSEKKVVGKAMCWKCVCESCFDHT